MDAPLSTVIGTVAGVLTTAAFVPQVWRTWRTKSVADLSLGMLVLFFVGIVGWLIYGVMLGEWPIIASNAVTLVLTAILVGLKLRYRRG
jgi:MtN3 and saliva related transmembrane protein